MPNTDPRRRRSLAAALERCDLLEKAVAKLTVLAAVNLALNQRSRRVDFVTDNSGGAVFTASSLTFNDISGVSTDLFDGNYSHMAPPKLDSLLNFSLKSAAVPGFV
jgi:hypothetical protein